MNQPYRRERTTDQSENLSRQALYRFLSLAFQDPRAGAWSELNDRGVQDCVSAATELLQYGTGAAIAEPGMGELPPSELDLKAVWARLPDCASELNAEYEATFGLLVSSDCPPYETEYIDSKFSFQRSQQLAEIAGFYHAFGLGLSDRHRERQDHISLELEFMAVVIGLEITAAGRLDTDPQAEQHLDVCRQAEANFLQSHLAWWVPAFARLLGHLHGDGFYSVCARLLVAVLPLERAALGVPSASVKAVPYGLERPEECEGCLLQP